MRLAHGGSIAMVAALGLGAPAWAQDPGSPTPAAPGGSRPGVVHEIRLKGDLVLHDQAVRLGEALRREQDLVVLEVTCESWRPGVLEAMAGDVARCEAPVAVVLRGDVVPSGAVLLGLCGDSVWIESGAVIRVSRSEGVFADEEELARCERAITELVTRCATGKIGEELVVRAFLRPQAEHWLLAGENGVRISAGLYDGPSWQLSGVTDDGSFDLVLSGRDLIACGMARELRREPSVAEEHGVRAHRRERTTIDASLDRERERALTGVNSLKRGLARVDKQLDEAESRFRASPSPARLRESGSDVLRELATLGGTLDSLDEHLGRFPEVLCTPPPGQSELTGGDREARMKAWTRAVGAIRKQADELRTRAEEIAAR